MSIVAEHRPGTAERPTTEFAAVTRTQAPFRLAEPGEYLGFRLGTEEYGLNILRVQEIRSYQQPTRIAGASDEVIGVLNLRGDIVPVIDLRVRFGLEPTVDASTVIVVLSVRDRTVGVVVDSVSDVQELSAQEIKPAPEFGGMADMAHITGIACSQRDGVERLLILLDIEPLVSDDGLASVGTTL